MLLPVRVDTLEVLHLLHKDEPHVRRFSQLTAGFHLHDTNALQKFRIRASSGNPVIYNCSNPSLCGRKFLFLLPHIPKVVLELVLSCYGFGYVHMEIYVVSDRSIT